MACRKEYILKLDYSNGAEEAGMNRLSIWKDSKPYLYLKQRHKNIPFPVMEKKKKITHLRRVSAPQSQPYLEPIEWTITYHISQYVKITERL